MGGGGGREEGGVFGSDFVTDPLDPVPIPFRSLNGTPFLFSKLDQNRAQITGSIWVTGQDRSLVSTVKGPSRQKAMDLTLVSTNGKQAQNLVGTNNKAPIFNSRAKLGTEKATVEIEQNLWQAGRQAGRGGRF